MLESLLISQVLLWIVILVLSLVCYALVRQIGVLYERIAPAGALAMNQKLAGGDKAPAMQLTALDNTVLSIGQPSGEILSLSSLQPAKNQLLFFLSPSCPLCKTLLPILKHIQRDQEASLDIILASDGEEVFSHQTFIKKEALEQFPYVISEPLGLSYGVSQLPYAVLINKTGLISALGVVNTREHLESLFEAEQLGQPTIQDYLHQQTSNDTTNNAQAKSEALAYEVR